jgi:hypothetical protein
VRRGVRGASRSAVSVGRGLSDSSDLGDMLLAGSAAGSAGGASAAPAAHCQRRAPCVRAGCSITLCT